MNNIIFLRNKIISFFYLHFLKPVFFRSDPEDVHDRMTKMGVFLGKYRIAKKIVNCLFGFRHPILEQTVQGIRFENPIGLAAGFDKDAQLTDILPSVGFGFAELGSITGDVCQGNKRPRLWRLLKSQSLVVYYGLKNQGAKIISEKLKNKKFKIPIGISIAKTNSPETCQLDNGINDYAFAFESFINIGDYITINISCPNAFGGEPFTHPERLEKLLERLDCIEYSKPVFIKLAASLSNQELDDILDVAARHRVHGFVCTNLAKDRNNAMVKEKLKDDSIPSKGGISGKVVQNLSDNTIERVYRKTRGAYTIIGVGGIFSAEDAYKKIKSGASLLQLITGMIFQGPQVVSEINRGLVGLLKQDGYSSIAEAVGVDVKLD